MAEAKAGIGAWLDFYNEERQHQSIGHRTPRQIYQEGLWTRKAYGYVEDRLCRQAPLPPPPEPARKAGKCSPSPTYPQAPLPTTDLIDEVNSRRGKPAVPPATGAGIETDRATP